MNLRKKIAFTSYLFLVIMTGMLGVKYLIAGEIRPHHLEIIGVSSWSAIEPGFRVMLLMLMKGAGLGYLITAIAIGFLLFGPFRTNETWSHWAVPLVCLTQLGGRLGNVLIMQANRPSSAPVGLLWIALLLVGIGIFLTINLRNEISSVEKKMPTPKHPNSSVVLYSLIALMCTITAYIYCSSKQIMPYHLDAVGLSNWEEMSFGYQFILLTYMRGAGVGFLTTAVAICMLLYAAHRNNDFWSRWGLFAVSLTQITVMLWIVLVVRMQTPGAPPIVPLALALIFAVLGFAISMKASCKISTKVKMV